MSHWTSIFAALGEHYDGSKDYNLTNFSLLNIFDHSGMIFEICHDAMQQEKLKDQVMLYLGIEIHVCCMFVCLHC